MSAQLQKEVEDLRAALARSLETNASLLRTNETLLATNTKLMATNASLIETLKFAQGVQ